MSLLGFGRIGPSLKLFGVCIHRLEVNIKTMMMKFADDRLINDNNAYSLTLLWIAS